VGSGNWGVSVGSWGSNVSIGSWGSNVSNGNWGSVGNGDWGSVGNLDGLVELLVDAGLSGDWSNNGLLGEDGVVSDDGLSNVVGVFNWGWLDVGNWGWLVNVGGLGDWVGDGGQLWGNLGVGLSGDNSIGEVSAQSVALDGSAVVLWGANNVRSSGDWGWGENASVGNSQKTSENNEALK